MHYTQDLYAISITLLLRLVTDSDYAFTVTCIVDFLSAQSLSDGPLQPYLGNPQKLCLSVSVDTRREKPAPEEYLG